jgi:hypothetical protein
MQPGRVGRNAIIHACRLHPGAAVALLGKAI